MKKTLIIFIATVIPLMLNATSIECSIVYHADTTQKDGKFRTKGASNSSVILSIHNNGKNLFVKAKGSNDSNELIYINKGMGARYFAEITPIGNANMFTFFDDGLLTVSKSYDMLGMMKMSVQDQYRCTAK